MAGVKLLEQFEGGAGTVNERASRKAEPDEQSTNAVGHRRMYGDE